MALSKKELVDTVAKGMQNKDLSQQAVGVLRRSTEKVLERIRQNVDAQVKEDAYPVIEEFCTNIASKLSAMSQQWVDGVSNDLVVFPEGTRYIFRDGDLTTVVVEQQPQNRHINIGGHVYMLAMPYVQFIIPFKNHVPCQQLYVGMTRKPINDLDGMIFNPVIPNINDHLVCTGDTPWPKNGTMTEKVDKIIGGFWQSAFTGDANQFMVQFMKDNDLQNLTAWQAKSQADPTFVLHKNTKFTPGKTIRRYLAVDKGGKSGTVSLVNNLKTEIVSAVGAIGGDLQKLLTNIDMKTENRDKPHIEVLQDVLKEIIVQVYSELWEYLQQQLQQDRAKLQSEMEQAATKLKKDFQYHMETMGKKKTW